jgi:hypothetical protein
MEKHSALPPEAVAMSPTQTNPIPQFPCVFISVSTHTYASEEMSQD